MTSQGWAYEGVDISQAEDLLASATAPLANYKGKDRENCLDIDPEILQKGIVNNSTGMINARTNIKNNLLVMEGSRAYLMTGSGAKHEYFLVSKANEFENYSLFYHRLTHKPNGNKVAYNYSLGKIYGAGLLDGEDNLLHLLAFHNPTDKELKKHHKNSTHPVVSIDIPEGRKINYTYKLYHGRKGNNVTKNRMVLIKAERPHAPAENYTYEDPTSDNWDRINNAFSLEDREELLDPCKLTLEDLNEGYHKLEAILFANPADMSLVGIPFGPGGAVQTAPNSAKGALSKQASSQFIAKGGGARGSESINAGVNLNKKLSQLEKAQKNAVKIRDLPDGRIRYYDSERSCFKKGPTRGASYVTEYNPRTGKIRGWNECYNIHGQIIRVHSKDINGQTVKANHYPPIYSELN